MFLKYWKLAEITGNKFLWGMHGLRDPRPCQIAINYVLKINVFLVCMQKTELLTVVWMHCSPFLLYTECIVGVFLVCMQNALLLSVSLVCMQNAFLCVCRMHCCWVYAECIIVVFLVCMQNALLFTTLLLQRQIFPKANFLFHSEDLAQTLNICTLISIHEFQNQILVSMLDSFWYDFICIYWILFSMYWLGSFYINKPCVNV